MGQLTRIPVNFKNTRPAEDISSFPRTLDLRLAHLSFIPQHISTVTFLNMATSRQPLRFQRPTTTKNFVHDEENCHENHPLVHLPPSILPVDRRSEWIETQWWLICLKPYAENSLAARKLLSVCVAKMPFTITFMDLASHQSYTRGELNGSVVVSSTVS